MKQKTNPTVEHRIQGNGRFRPESSAKIPNNVVGPQVKKQRGLLGLTQAQLNERLRNAGLKIGKTAIARIESQRRHVSDIEFFALARFLQTSPDVLLPFNDPRVKREIELMRRRPDKNVYRPGYTEAELSRLFPGLKL